MLTRTTVRCLPLRHNGDLAKKLHLQRYKCRLIEEMLADRMNYLYFTFITPSQKFEKINSLFQQTNGDLYELSKELLLHHKNLHRKFYDQIGSCKSLECVDFGAKFKQEVGIHLAKFINGSIHQEKRRIEDVKSRCQALLQEALSQAPKRLPDSVEIFKRLSSSYKWA